MTSRSSGNANISVAIKGAGGSAIFGGMGGGAGGWADAAAGCADESGLETAARARAARAQACRRKMKGIVFIVSDKGARSSPWQSRVLVAGGKPVGKW